MTQVYNWEVHTVTGRYRKILKERENLSCAPPTVNMVDKVTAVKWQWRADDKWTDFPAAMNLKLELEYQKGTKQIKVDDERFVDVGLTVSGNLAILYQTN